MKHHDLLQIVVKVRVYSAGVVVGAILDLCARSRVVLSMPGGVDSRVWAVAFLLRMKSCELATGGSCRIRLAESEVLHRACRKYDVDHKTGRVQVTAS